MEKTKNDYMNLNYEFNGCGDYDKPIIYSQQSKEELKKLQERKNKIIHKK